MWNRHEDAGPALQRRAWLRWIGLWGAALALRGQRGWAACAPTAPNPQGPFYLPGAPFREDLAAAEEPGRPLVLAGRVLSAATCEPLSGAVLDAWHASDAGVYYGLETTLAPFEPHLLRARVRCGGEGRYSLRTILPGHYRLSRTRYRARHIHVIVSHPGQRPVTTQIYFAGDPHLAGDPLARPELIVTLREENTTLAGSFDFHLPP